MQYRICITLSRACFLFFPTFLYQFIIYSTCATVGPLPSVSSELSQSLQHLPPFFHINAVAITPVFYERKVPKPLYLSHFLFFIPKFTSLLFRNMLCYIPNPCVTLFRNSSVAFSDMTCWEFRAWTAPHSDTSRSKFRLPLQAIPKWGSSAFRPFPSFHSETKYGGIPFWPTGQFRNRRLSHSEIANDTNPKITKKPFRKNRAFRPQLFRNYGGYRYADSRLQNTSGCEAGSFSASQPFEYLGPVSPGTNGASYAPSFNSSTTLTRVSTETWV